MYIEKWQKEYNRFGHREGVTKELLRESHLEQNSFYLHDPSWAEPCLPLHLTHLLSLLLSVFTLMSVSSFTNSFVCFSKEHTRHHPLFTLYPLSLLGESPTSMILSYYTIDSKARKSHGDYFFSPYCQNVILRQQN